MATMIAEAYFKLIKAGRKELSDVPEQIKTEVQTLLDADKAAQEAATQEV